MLKTTSGYFKMEMLSLECKRIFPVAIDYAKDGDRVCMLCLEKSPEWILTTYLADVARVDPRNIKNGKITERQFLVISAASEGINLFNIEMMDRNSVRECEMEALARRLKDKGAKHIVVVGPTRICREMYAPYESDDEEISESISLWEKVGAVAMANIVGVRVSD